MNEPPWVTVYAICDECKLSAEVRGRLIFEPRLSRPTAGASCLVRRGFARLAALSDTFPSRSAQPFWLSCLLHLAKAGVCPDGRLLLIC